MLTQQQKMIRTQVRCCLHWFFFFFFSSLTYNQQELLSSRNPFQKERLGDWYVNAVACDIAPIAGARCPGGPISRGITNR